MERIGERNGNEIPPIQAAYRKSRSTTEHVFSTKLVIERPITSRNETVYLMMHDMSKAFDSVNRTVLISNLNKILEKDEVRIYNTKLVKLIMITHGGNVSCYEVLWTQNCCCC